MCFLRWAAGKQLVWHAGLRDVSFGRSQLCPAPVWVDSNSSPKPGTCFCVGSMWANLSFKTFSEVFLSYLYNVFCFEQASWSELMQPTTVLDVQDQKRQVLEGVRVGSCADPQRRVSLDDRYSSLIPTAATPLQCCELKLCLLKVFWDSVSPSETSLRCAPAT